MGALATGISAFVKTFGGGGGLSSETVSSGAFENLVNAWTFTTDTTDDTFRNADHESTLAAASGKHAGDQITTIGLDLKNITEHTYNTVIPKSLGWLRGDLLVHYIDPIRQNLGRLNNWAKIVDKWRTQIDTWRTTYVDPEIRKWQAFKKWFDGYPTTVVDVWNHWFQHPDQFANWIVNYLVKPLVVAFSDKGNLPSLDTLTQEILQASPNRYRYAVAAFEQMLDEPWP
jgi:hypothetical protein